MRRLQMILALGVFLLLAGLWYLLVYADRFPKYNWSPVLTPAKNEPFGTELFTDYLQANERGIPVKKLDDFSISFLSLSETGSAFVYVSPYEPRFQSEERLDLMEFLEQGGRMVLFCPSLGNLSDEVLKEEAQELIALRAESRSFLGKKGPIPFSLAGAKTAFYFSNPSPFHDSLSQFSYAFFRMNAEWRYLKTAPIVRGFAGHEVNLLEIPVGKGKIIWHCQPEILGNFFVKKKPVRKYLDQLFALAYEGKKPDGKNLYLAYAFNPPQQVENQNRRKSPLTYILSVPAFRWAWYVLLFGTLAWFLFLAKRRQRIVPLIPEKTNSSLHFIQAISELYFRRQNHYFICQQKMKLFLSHVRTRYGLNIQQFNSEMVGMLARRSGCNPDLIQDIIQDWNYIQEFSMERTSADQLARFHSLTESFYNQTASR
jgi:hypothetical protein